MLNDIRIYEMSIVIFNGKKYKSFSSNFQVIGRKYLIEDIIKEKFHIQFSYNNEIIT